MPVLHRPGGELAGRPLNIFWIVDCSHSMGGEKIETVNKAIRAVIPEMLNAEDCNPSVQLFIRTLMFSTGANWITDKPVKAVDFVWEDLKTGGVTDLGKAFDLLHDQLTIPPMSERALPPVLILLSDGQPTDNYKKSLDKLLKLPWSKKAIRIAISIGQNADDDVLCEFTGNKELVLQANNALMLTSMIKWSSTVVSLVSAPASRTIDNSCKTPGNSAQGYLDTTSIPKHDAYNDVW